MIRTISKKRVFKDRLAAFVAMLCGGGIILALALMLGYLFWEAAVLALPADAEQVADWRRGDRIGSNQLWLSDRGEKALEVSPSGIRLLDLPSSTATEVTGWQPLQGFPIQMLLRNSVGSPVALALNDAGRMLLFEPGFRLEWDAQTTDYHTGEVVPTIAWPLGKEVLHTGLIGPPDQAAFLLNERQLLLLTANSTRLRLTYWQLRPSVFADGHTATSRRVVEINLLEAPQQLLIGTDGLIYVLNASGQLRVLRLRNGQLQPVETLNLLPGGASLARAGLLLGGKSLIVADSQGGLALWRSVRTASGTRTMRLIRQYEATAGAVKLLLSEPHRKGFFAFYEHGEADAASFYYIGEEAGRYRLDLPRGQRVQRAWLHPAGKGLSVQSGQNLGYWHIDNEYADISTSLLWAPKWYEGYQGAQWIWQSTSADTDFEPKFSILPLVIGTLKGAFYAMLFAVPIALLAAIYVARFMAPSARALAKPTIEIMAAMPTVILGFLAALWLAPLVGLRLSGILLGIAALPGGMVLFAWLIQKLPKTAKRLAPDGWEFVIAVPLCGLLFAGCVSLSPVLDILFFGGDFIVWLDDTLGLDYEQRNAAIVGIAMSFAVIPTVFSIAEDALYQAPKSLLEGGLGLGATHWQAVVRIIIPTASPGIFSGLIIGLGRAVGETMVVVMATGNTPLLDWLPFSGMRTLSANIAVEMPEAEIGSSHFHLLFLSAVLLFVMTFIANSAAEYVRQNLRNRYANL